ncbi:MAG TPA: hemolysin III family protein [Geobacterales bacterium]|nr:hemolysin III family protein [Geobacterales bacterium]
MSCLTGIIANLCSPLRTGACAGFPQTSRSVTLSREPYNALDPPGSLALCALVWSLAAAGIVLLLAFPRCFARVSLALYLGISWIVLGVIRTLIDRLPIEAVALLVGGGVVYSVGALIHTRERWRFHTPVWHALVLLAAGLHLTALYAAFLSVT